MTTVLLARHGETTWNRTGRVQGWAPTTLTDCGHRQARALGDHLAAAYHVDRVFASDLRRVEETTAHVARAVGVEPRYERAWRERDFGNLQGLLADALFRRHPQYALSVVGHAAARERPPGGESVLDLRERVLTRWRELLADVSPGETVLVVSHGGPIRVVLGGVKGLDIVATVLDQSQDNCAVNELGYDPAGDEIALRLENETGFLADDCAGAQ